MKKIFIIHENDEWVIPLEAELKKNKLKNILSFHQFYLISAMTSRPSCKTRSSVSTMHQFSIIFPF